MFENIFWLRLSECVNHLVFGGYFRPLNNQLLLTWNHFRCSSLLSATTLLYKDCLKIQRASIRASIQGVMISALLLGLVGRRARAAFPNLTIFAPNVNDQLILRYSVATWHHLLGNQIEFRSSFISGTRTYPERFGMVFWRELHRERL